MTVTAHYSVLKDYASINGGVNNLYVAKLVNHRMQNVKSFTSKLSFEAANKRAEKYLNNFLKK